MILAKRADISGLAAPAFIAGRTRLTSSATLGPFRSDQRRSEPEICGQEAHSVGATELYCDCLLVSHCTSNCKDCKHQQYKIRPRKGPQASLDGGRQTVRSGDNIKDSSQERYEPNSPSLFMPRTVSADCRTDR